MKHLENQLLKQHFQDCLADYPDMLITLQAVAKEQIEDIEGKDKEQFPVAGFGRAAVAAGAQIW